MLIHVVYGLHHYYQSQMIGPSHPSVVPRLLRSSAWLWMAVVAPGITPSRRCWRGQRERRRRGRGGMGPGGERDGWCGMGDAECLMCDG